MCCATRNKHPHGAPCTRRRNQNDIRMEPNGEWRKFRGSTFWQSNERAGWTYTTTSARLAGRRMLFPLPPCRFGKTLSTADTHTHSRNGIKNTRRVCAVGSVVMKIYNFEIRFKNFGGKWFEIWILKKYEIKINQINHIKSFEPIFEKSVWKILAGNDSKFEFNQNKIRKQLIARADGTKKKKKKRRRHRARCEVRMRAPSKKKNL
jgi:hypothetical protein